MDRVKKKFRSLNTKLSHANLVDDKRPVGVEDTSTTKTTEYLPNRLQNVTSPTVGTFNWESEQFNHSSDNVQDHSQPSTSPQANLPSTKRREETSMHSQNGGSTDRKSVYRPPWLPKAEDEPVSAFDLLIGPLVELNTLDHATQAKETIDCKHGGEQTMEEDTQSYDLRPPTLPKRYSLGIENTVDSLYGEQHLQNILKDKKLRREFVTFLEQRLPSQMVHMVRLSENEKAIAAITYANAIAQSQRPMTGSQQPAVAAIISDQFVQDGQRAFGMLLAEGLPAYIAHVLTNEAMKYMEKQIPRMRLSQMDQQPVKGVSEVFCLTDPNMKDHPIIYASKQFFRLMQYGRDYAIGRNCRFLQGPKTASDSVFRLGRAIRDGREVCETILNYRRDGTPFLNLLLMAPLRDGQGNYFLGAQIDVSGIVKDCPGLEAHKRILNQESFVEPQTPAQAAESIPVRLSSRHTNQTMNGLTKHKNGYDRVHNKLHAFLEKLSPDEIATLRERERRQSLALLEAITPQPDGKASNKSIRLERQYLSDEDPVIVDAQDPPTPTLLTAPPLAPAGSLPGVYHNYLLVRPDPSLHILFASSALQTTADLRQTPLLSHISTSVNTLASLQKAFVQGIPVTGRVVWKPTVRAAGASNGMSTSRTSALSSHPPGMGSHASWHSNAEALGASVAGQSQWMSATPLVGSDDRVGVWVIVIVKAPYGGAVGEMF